MAKRENGRKAFRSAAVMLLLATFLFASNADVWAAAGNAAAEGKSVTEVPSGYTPIYNVNDLYSINANPSGKYILMEDIDLSETKEGGELDSGGAGCR